MICLSWSWVKYGCLPRFGFPKSSVNGTTDDRIRFAGKERDPESGLDYFGARYHAAQTGRFIATDPLLVAASASIDPQQWQRYSYVKNNPLRFIDPDGRQSTGTVQAECHESGSTDCIDENVAVFFIRSFFGVFHPVFPRIGIPPETSMTCAGSARVLMGNARTIGRPGGFSGSSVGTIPVTANGAAVIPSQWASSRATLRPYLNRISGSFPGTGASFQGIVDIVGGEPPRGVPAGTNVQQALMAMYPGQLIIELPGASRDLGVNNVSLSVPPSIGCPAGTSGVR